MNAERTKASIRESRWPGWIWSIPAAALLLLGWWGIRLLTAGGEDVTISFDDAHGLKKDDADVMFRGMIVGKVNDIKLSQDGRSVEATVHIDEAAKRYLTTGTQFWLKGASPDLSDLGSLASLLSGPTIEMEPGPGSAAKKFQGLAHKPLISGGRGTPQYFRIVLDGDVGALERGSPVKLRGFTVGEVTEIGLHYDPDTAGTATPVTIALYPTLFHLDDGTPLPVAALRARLDRDPPFIGAPLIVLDAPSTAPPQDDKAEIPTADEGGLDSIVGKVNKLPLDQIAQTLLDAMRHIDQIVASPKIGDAINQLDATLAEIHAMAGAAAPQVPKIVDSLRKASAQLESVASEADKTLGGNSQYGAQAAIRELTETARSIRNLADYLNRHPDALIKGRSGP